VRLVGYLKIYVMIVVVVVVSMADGVEVQYNCFFRLNTTPVHY